mmetsp:Transcript_18754/g.58594  ORF Transcript_18754/g.58594 Transcript_18754/m.58594 type:complete len:581 (-) Transcript_18754:465-2207(-)
MPLIENILYTMDAYNDAGHRSLFILSQCFLYDEIEAEVNLIFDQLIFLISDQVYSYYKDIVVSREIDISLREHLVKQNKYDDLPAQRYYVPTSQRNIQLLGRVIDLNILITQHVNGEFYKDVDYCIKKFEANNLSHMIDFQKALASVYSTHSALCQYLDLDSFEGIVTEVDEAVGPAAFAGRTMIHVLASLVTDTFPNYSYNGFTRRFTRSPVMFSVVDRPKNPKADHQHFAFGAHPIRALEMANRLHKSFIGTAHIEAIVCVLGNNGIPLLITNLLTNIEEHLERVQPYLCAIKEGIPPCKLPRAMYGLAGCYGVFDALLKPILAYADLKPEVFRAFKEIGNSICFIRDISDTLDCVDLRRCLQARISLKSPLGGHSQCLNDLVSLTLQLDRPGASYQPKSLFSGALSLLDVHIQPFKAYWVGRRTISELESMESFHRLWSAMAFLFGMQSSKYCGSSEHQLTDPIPDDAQYGHGFFVAGVHIMHLLGQTRIYHCCDFSKHVLRVKVLEAAAAARIRDVGLADSNLCNKACDFVELKMKHEHVFVLVISWLWQDTEDAELAPLLLWPPSSYVSSKEVAE